MMMIEEILMFVVKLKILRINDSIKNVKIWNLMGRIKFESRREEGIMKKISVKTN